MYLITYHFDVISLTSSDANQKNSVYTSLTALDSGTQTVDVRDTRASQWIPRQTADFVQDPHPVRKNMRYWISLVLDRNEYYLV